MKKKPKNKIQEGLKKFNEGSKFAIGLGILLLLIYFGIMREEKEIALQPYEIYYQEVIYLDRSRGDDIRLITSAGFYWFNLSLWSDFYETEYILNELRSTNKCIVWLKSREDQKVFGLKSDKINIPPTKGLELHNLNIDMWLVLAILFIVLPTIMIIVEKYYNTV